MIIELRCKSIGSDLVVVELWQSMSQSTGVEELYRNFGILADAGESMSEVRGGMGGITCKTPAHSIVTFYCTSPCDHTPFTPLLHPQHASAYEGIIKAAKGSLGEKKLAAGFITRFFQHFPALAENAMDAMLDLIEDEDAQVNAVLIKWGVNHFAHKLQVAALQIACGEEAS